MNGTMSCVLEEITDAFTPRHWTIVLVTPDDYAALLIYLIIFFTGVPLNLLIMWRIAIKKLYRYPTFILLLNLAISDLLVCMIPILFNIITGFIGSYSFGSTDYVRCQVCKLAALFIMFNFLNMFNLVLISLDRFTYFKMSIKYIQLVTVKRVLLALLFIWSLSFVLIILPLVGYGDVVFSLSCGPVFLSSSHKQRSTPFIALGIIAYIVVIVILTVTNVWIVCIGLKQIRSLKVHPAGTVAATSTHESDLQHKVTSQQIAIMRKQFKLFQVFGVILVIHFMTLVPAILLVGIVVFSGTIPRGFYTFVLASILSQATLHPLVEALFTPELRKFVTKYCKMLCPKRDQSRWFRWWEGLVRYPLCVKCRGWLEGLSRCPLCVKCRKCRKWLEKERRMGRPRSDTINTTELSL